MKRLLLLFALHLPLPAAIATDGVLYKYSYETPDLSLDFTNRAPNGITFDYIQAIDAVTSVDVTSLVIAASPAPGVLPMTNKIAWRVQGGVPLEQVNILVHAIRSDTGAKLEGLIAMNILQE